MTKGTTSPARSTRRWSWSLRLCCLAFVLIACGMAYVAERRREFLIEEETWQSQGLLVHWKFGGWNRPTTTPIWQWFDRVDAVNLRGGNAGMVPKLVVFRELRILSIRGYMSLIDSRPGFITDRSLEYVSRLPKLERLDISGHPITDAGILRLAAAPSLAHLVLDVTQVTSAGEYELQRLRPDLQIHHAATPYVGFSGPEAPEWFFDGLYLSDEYDRLVNAFPF